MSASRSFALILSFFLASAVNFASAAIISTTGGNSGGNPGGQPLYEVSGLVQGDAFNLTWGGVSGLDVDGMVFIDALSATDAEIRIMVDNMSAPISGADPRITAVGFEVDGFSSVAVTTGGTHLDKGDDGNFPGFSTDVCGTSGNNCAGGGNGGVPAGSTDSFTLDIAGNFGSSLNLRNFALKIQGGPSGNSFELSGVPTDKVPEPASLVLFACSLAGLAYLRGRSRTT